MIVLLKYIIDKQENIINLYKKYTKKPIIFCDQINVVLDNIPIFHSFYLNNYFHKKYILMDYQDYLVAKEIEYNCEKYIVLCEDRDQLLHNMPHTFLLNNEDINERLQQIIR